MGKRKKTLVLLGLVGVIFLIYVLAFNSAAAQTGDQPIPGVDRSADTDQKFSLPLIFKPPDPTPVPPPTDTPPKTLFCNKPSINIPDNNQSGISNTITITDPRFIGDIDVRLDIDHSWVGDLNIYLTHLETGRSIQLVDRPGSASPENPGCGSNNFKAILDDDISLPVENECSTNQTAIGVGKYIEAAIAGTYIPDQALMTFDEKPISGNSTLTESDRFQDDTGKLNQWCIAAELIDTPVIPTIPPLPSGMPKQALITGVYGQTQALPLDCESRSAVDWASYFGEQIDERKFFYGLPHSDNPDLGFAGGGYKDPLWGYGDWGQIPPQPYGVHAEPVAKRLRHFGLSAVAQQPLPWKNLKAEIAAGRPVIVWIVGSNPLTNGIPEYYQPKEGHNTVVAHYEHTVIVTGYSQDSVYYLNGGTIYPIVLKQFLESWSALGNMAITMQP